MKVRRRDVLTVLLVAAIAHLTYFRAVPAIVWPDSARYANLGDGFFRYLATGQWDLWTTPGYPLFVWVLTRANRTVDAVILGQQILAIATCVLVLVIGQKLLGRREGLVGALLVTVHPVRHYYAQALLSESLAEFLVVAGFAALVAAMRAGPGAFLAWRGMVGFLLGLAALVRPNLAPAIAVATLVPIIPERAVRRVIWLTAGALVTLVAAFLVLLPWLTYNARRGEFGLALNSGWNIHAYANDLGIPRDTDTEPLLSAHPHSLEIDRQLRSKVIGRFLGAPHAYIPGVFKTTVSLLLPIDPKGDVAPAIARCEYAAGDESFATLPRPIRFPISWWRCRLHGLALPVFAVLISGGWLGLMVWSIDSLRCGRYDLAGLGLLPLVIIGAHALTLLWNTRFAFPCEALALGIGLPAGLAVGWRSVSARRAT
jgi:4-amino-4-deoxy-L-arabinose transferase-like glycosyltransferase